MDNGQWTMNSGQWKLVLLLAVILIVGVIDSLSAQNSGIRERMVIRGGAMELNVGGDLAYVEDVTDIHLNVQGYYFFATHGGVAAAGLESGYFHQRNNDAVELQGLLSWQRMPVRRSYHWFAAIGGGLRQEWAGSFSQARFPLGIDAGLRLLPSLSSAVKIDLSFSETLQRSAAKS